MTIPNHADVPRKLFDTGLFNLKTEDGEGAFTDAVVACLNGRDSNWRHLKKSSAQTHVHRHGEDSALYLFPDGTAQAVDFIGGAGGTNPQPGWIVDDITVYRHSDAHDPDDHGIGGAPAPPQPSIPSYEAIGGDPFFRSHVGVPLQADMALAGQTLNDGSSVWFSRTCYSLLVARMNGATDTDAILRRHRNEWRAILGLPPL